MLQHQWLVASADHPGRCFVVRLIPPRWYYVFNHVAVDGGCMLQSQASQFLTKGVPSEHIYSEDLAGQTALVLQTVAG